MAKDAYLILEDGTCYRGESFGAEIESRGEVVFNTSMTGYQEMLTDPSYSGQIVVPSYPIVGNYGVNVDDVESGRVQVAGFVVREHCDYPSHTLSTMTLHQYLLQENIAGITGVDTRALVRKIRTTGVMMGIITTSDNPGAILKNDASTAGYGDTDFVSRVSTVNGYEWESTTPESDGPLITVVDCGLKYNILRTLVSKGCRVLVMPSASTAADILNTNPDGVILSPGPGDPALLDYLVETGKGLLERVPILGICLGHQVIARAVGGQTFKLKFGHRGANHPVREIATGRVHITSQNHGYAVDSGSLPSELGISHVNLHDGTIEGLKHKELPVMTIQYHSEASPGPLDNLYVFDDFLSTIKGSRLSQ